MTYRWIAEPRVVPVLRRLLAKGDEFEAEPRIGNALVAQGLAEVCEPPKFNESEFEIDADRWDDDEP